MPRENSFTDSEGRSLTPDLSEEEDHDFIGPASPVTTSPVAEVAPEHLTSTTNPDVPNIVASMPERVSSVTSAPSGLPPTTSPSVLFKDSEKLTPTVSAPAGPQGNAPPVLAPGDRFRASVRKIIHMKRTSSALSTKGVGAEPGIDPRRASAYMNYGHIKQKCSIQVVDYSSVRSSFGRMENKGFLEFLGDPKAYKREPWVKVRWINIGGISWDVMSALAIRYSESCISFMVYESF